MPRRSRLPVARDAFTLLELLIVISVVAIVAAVVLPTMSDDRFLRVRAAAGILISDIEYAQTLTISYPSDRVVLRFGAGQTPDRYWLAYADTPDQPLIRADTGEPYLVILGEGRARTTAGVHFKLTDVPSGTLSFNAQGGLTDFTNSPKISVVPPADQGSVGYLELTISSSTGRIFEEVVKFGAK